MVYAFNPSTEYAEARGLLELEASLMYIVTEIKELKGEHELR